MVFGKQSATHKFVVPTVFTAVSTSTKNTSLSYKIGL